MVAATAGGLIPGVGGIIGGMAGSAVGTATLAGGFKSKDEITFEYYLTAPDGKERLPKTTSKQKAKKDGEDVLTPQLRTAALTVIQEVSPRPRIDRSAPFHLRGGSCELLCRAVSRSVRRRNAWQMLWPKAFHSRNRKCGPELT